MAHEVKIFGVFGAGVIGAAWAARASMCGLEVIVYDPSPKSCDIVAKACRHAERAYRKLSLAPLTRTGEVRFCDNLGGLSECDFIQENLPEDPELKMGLLAELDSLVGDNVIIASSTSGLSPSLLQSKMVRGDRFIVGHPFNPVYLMPLVEVCGGSATSVKTRDSAVLFYESLGMQALLLKAEVSGFIADRLMEALWREALWLVHDGVADVSDIDDALRFGPGLRWSFMGSFLTYRLAGGEGGMRHFLEHFAPSLQWDWTRLEAPPWSDELLERIVEQSDIQAGQRSYEDYELLRDDCLVGVLQALKGEDFGAGRVMARLDRVLFTASHTDDNKNKIDISVGLPLHEAVVLPEFLDYNGHMTESRYLQVFGDASSALYNFVGCGVDYLESGFSFFTAETHLRHLGEGIVGGRLEIISYILGVWDRRLHFFHEMYCGGKKLASCEMMAVHVDTKGGGAVAIGAEIRSRLDEILLNHKKLKLDGVGRFIGEPRT